MFNVILGSFGALVSKWPVTREWLAVEQNSRRAKRTEIWDSGGSCHMGGTFDLLVLKVILGSFSALVSH